jgi:competence protein ComEC
LAQPELQHALALALPPEARVATRLDAWAGAERGRFALWLPVFMGAGAALYFALRVQPAPWTGPAVLACAIALAALLRRRTAARAIVLALLAAALGFAAAQLATWRAIPFEPLPGKAVILTATVQGVEILPDSRRLTLAAAVLAEGAAPLARRIHVRLKPDDATPVEAGDTIRLRALLRPPAPPAYPGGWDLQRDDYFSGLGGGGTALGPVTVVEHAAPRGLIRWWQGLRDAIAARLIAGLPGPDGAIAATLLTGGQSAIPPADRAAFRDSGLAHLLAVAGLHIGIVMGLAMGLARLLLALSERASLHWPTKQIAAAFALLAGALYMALTGAHVPIIRSFAMASLVVLGLMVGRRALSLRGLAVAAAVLILIAPQEVVGVSFQMSFSAVLALIAGYEALRPVLMRLHGDGVLRRTLSHVVALALTSLLAGTASAPFAAYHFGHVQLYYVVANIVAVPITAMLVLPAGMAALALMPLHLERLALLPMGWGIDAVLWVGRSVSAWPSATIAVPHMPGWGLAVLALGLAWLGLWRSPLRAAGLLAIALGLVSPVLVRPPDLLVSPDARLIALRTPEGAFVQSKSGSKFTEGEWLQYWALRDFAPMPRAAGAVGGEAVVCTDIACTLRARPDAPPILLVRNAAKQAACDAPLVVSAEPARPCAGGRLIDRFTVWREGAQAVWLDPAGIRILSDREARGDRPWVIGPPARQDGAKSSLPAAKTESLPADF